MIPSLHPTAAQILVAADDSIKDDLDGPNDLLATPWGYLPSIPMGHFYFSPKTGYFSPKTAKKRQFWLILCPFTVFLYLNL